MDTTVSVREGPSWRRRQSVLQVRGQDWVVIGHPLHQFPLLDSVPPKVSSSTSSLATPGQELQTLLPYHRKKPGFSDSK